MPDHRSDITKISKAICESLPCLLAWLGLARLASQMELDIFVMRPGSGSPLTTGCETGCIQSVTGSCSEPARGEDCPPPRDESATMISRSEGLARTRLFHPWGHEPEGGGQAPMFPCRTLSDPAKIPNQKFGISTTGPSPEIPDLADRSALMRECHCFRR